MSYNIVIYRNTENSEDKCGSISLYKCPNVFPNSRWDGLNYLLVRQKEKNQ